MVSPSYMTENWHVQEWNLQILHIWKEMEFQNTAYPSDILKLKSICLFSLTEQLGCHLTLFPLPPHPAVKHASTRMSEQRTDFGFQDLSMKVYKETRN